jgi:hypothetical protein
LRNKAIWNTQFGTAGSDSGLGIAVDHNGNLFVTGGTRGNLGAPYQGNGDAYVAKLDGDGSITSIWQLGTTATDSGVAVSFDHGRGVFVAGLTGGTLPGQQSAGGGDAFVAWLVPEPHNLPLLAMGGQVLLLVRRRVRV